MKRIPLAIVGSGPAGLTASIYASRYRIPNMVFGGRRGGTIGYAHKVENYPGFESISGLALMEKVEAQAVKLGAGLVEEAVTKIEPQKGFFSLSTVSGAIYKARTVILATGTERRKLGVPGEAELLGRGVSYCTTCDVPFFRDQTVAVVGGSDGAVSGALHAAAFARRVFLIHRGEALGAEPIWTEQVLKRPKIERLYRTNVTAILGPQKVRAVKLDRSYRGADELAVGGVFIEIGGLPANELGADLKLETDAAGYFRVDGEMRTSRKGVFAAGDNTDFWPDFRQLVTAQAMGARAALSAYKYLSRLKNIEGEKI